MGLTRITSDGIADGAIAGADLADQSVTLAKLPHGTSSNDGKFLRANNGADPTFETVNTDLVADTSPQLGGNLDVNTKNIVFGDSSDGSSDDVLSFGAGTDLSIYHNGTASKIDNTTGNLTVKTDNTFGLYTYTGTEAMAKFIANGAVELYHDNSKKLETSSVGWKSEDDVKGTFGTGGDLQIYHSGSNSFLKKVASGTGHLYIDSDGSDLYLRAGDGGTGRNIALKCTDNAGVDLRYQGTVKLDTTSVGVSVAGRIAFTGTGQAIDLLDDQEIRLGTGDDLMIFHDGSDSHIHDNGTGQLILRADNFRVNNANNTENMIVANENGEVSLYYDDSKKLETISSGVKLIGDASVGSICEGDFRFKEAGSGTTRIHWRSDEGDLKFNDTYKATFGSGNDLKIYHDGSESVIGNSTGTFQFLSPNQIRYRASTHEFLSYANDETLAKFIDDGAVELYFNNSKKLETVTGGVYIYGELLFGVGGSGNLFGGDNKKLILGSGSDFQFYHDGTDSYINNATGNLSIQSDGNLKLERKDGGEDYIHCIADGAVELHYNGTRTFETTASGCEVTGDLQVSGDIEDSGGGHGSTAAEIFDGRAKVFVNFRGTSTVAIRASKGVSSITDAATGKYQVNLSVNLANSNYTALGNAGMNDEAGSDTSAVDIRDPNTTNFRLHNEDVDHGHTDREFMYAIVFTGSA